MHLRGKPLSEVGEDDLRGLIGREDARECTALEYKQTLPSQTDSDKKEFLSDVSSFANASGGVIVFGVEEKGGLPTNLTGIVLADPDSEISRLSQSIAFGIRPRIHGMQFHPVRLSSGKWIILIGIPRSLYKPHMVTYQGANRFCVRVSSRKQDMDVDELRAAFLGSATLLERLRAFRFDRLSAIKAGETPVSLAPSPSIVIQVVPVDAIASPVSLSIDAVWKSRGWRDVRFPGDCYERVNIDGLLAYQVDPLEPRPDKGLTYIQVCRNGAVEVVDALALRQGAEFPSWTEDRIALICWRTLRLHRELAFDPPIVVFISLLGVRGFRFAWHPREPLPLPLMWGQAPVDRDDLLLPELWLDDYPRDGAAFLANLKPAFDALWNAAGLPGWLRYEECVRRSASQMA